MHIKGIQDEEFLNYKKPSMFICTTKCSFKCGKDICSNAELMEEPDIEIPVSELVTRYKNNPITEAIVVGGLEPFDTFSDLIDLLEGFRDGGVEDDIVIYTGYEKSEIAPAVQFIANMYKNIIIKFGRFKYLSRSKFDDILGVTLASENQYAEKIC